MKLTHRRYILISYMCGTLTISVNVYLFGDWVIYLRDAEIQYQHHRIKRAYHCLYFIRELQSTYASAIGVRNVSEAWWRGQSGQFLHFWPPIFVRHSGPDVIGLNKSGHDQSIDVCLSVYEVCSQSFTAGGDLSSNTSHFHTFTAGQWTLLQREIEQPQTHKLAQIHTSDAS